MSNWRSLDKMGKKKIKKVNCKRYPSEIISNLFFFNNICNQIIQSKNKSQEIRAFSLAMSIKAALAFCGDN